MIVSDMAAVRMVCVLVLSYLVALFSSTYGAEFVPVLIWESTKPAGAVVNSPALKKYSTDDFADFFLKKLSSYSKKPTVLVFAEENLSVEDFSLQNEVFPRLQDMCGAAAAVELLPSVQRPLKALRRLQNHGYTLHNDATAVPEERDAVVLMKLDDARADEDRPDFLRRHDKIMSEVYSQFIKERRDVVAVYTGHYSSWIEPENEPVIHRVRRLLAEGTTNSTTLVLNATEILVYARDLPVLIVSGDTVTLQPKDRAKLDKRSTHESLKVQFLAAGNSTPYVQLDFIFSNTSSTTGYWSLDKINVTFITNGSMLSFLPDTNIFAPFSFSYHCSSQTVFRNNNTKLVFDNFQAQPYMDNKGVSFGDAYNCEYFFTAPIWSGLFVTSILALIMIWGLVMIMDIRTMDQFDDPKGKTITISVSE